MDMDYNEIFDLESETPTGENEQEVAGPEWGMDRDGENMREVAGLAKDDTEEGNPGVSAGETTPSATPAKAGIRVKSLCRALRNAVNRRHADAAQSSRPRLTRL